MEGKARSVVGKTTGDKTEDVKGRAEEVVGKVQKNMGKGERKV